MSRARDLADLGGSADAGGITGRNLIINGNMSIAQRGTSSTASGIGCVDRFQHTLSGGTATSSQESLSSSDTPYSLGFRNYIRMTNGTTTSAASGQRQIYQNIEAQNLAKSGWNYTSTSSYVTVSFWVRSSLAGKYGAYLLTYDGTAQQFSFTYTLAANTWTKITKTIPGNSNLTFNDDNGLGMSLVVYSWLGTDYTDSTATMDAWVANDATKYFQEDLADWGGTSSATLDVTAVQLEVGETATPFEHRSYGDELARCQRYFELLGHAALVTSSNTALSLMSLPFNGATDNQWMDIPFIVEKRAAPTSIVAFNGYDVPTAASIGFSTNGATLYHTSQMTFFKVGGSGGDAVASVSAEL